MARVQSDDFVATVLPRRVTFGMWDVVTTRDGRVLGQTAVAYLNNHRMGYVNRIEVGNGVRYHYHGDNGFRISAYNILEIEPFVAWDDTGCEF